MTQALLSDYRETEQKVMAIKQTHFNRFLDFSEIAYSLFLISQKILFLPYTLAHFTGLSKL